MTTDEYADYRKDALEAGVSEEEVDRAVADLRREGELMDKLVCPQCSGKLTRTEDDRQTGPTEIVGRWFNYRCLNKCDWFADRCEPVGEN